jgi:hypothetical protein
MTGAYHSTEDTPGLGLCRTCYECFIVGTRFEKRFNLVNDYNGQVSITQMLVYIYISYASKFHFTMLLSIYIMYKILKVLSL